MARALLFYCDGDDGQLRDALREALRKVDPTLEFRVWPEAGERKDIVYAAVWIPPDELFDDLSSLEAVFALSAGVDLLLANPALPDCGPVVRLEDAGMAESMAEYVLFGVLHAHRGLPHYTEAQRARRWSPRASLLAASDFRVGILGSGVLGHKVATRLRDNGYAVSCWSRRPHSMTAGIEHVNGPDALLPLAARCNVLVCLLPLTYATRGILDRRVFDAMPQGGFLINAARGEHLIDDDLLEAIQQGKLSGALLDVMHEEPAPESHPFWDEARIVITPHVSAPTQAHAAAVQTSQALAAMLEGTPPPGLVDRISGY